jgi:hypothetical protein
MNNNKIRQLIINLLDDEHGINGAAYTDLYDLAIATGNRDILPFVENQDIDAGNGDILPLVENQDNRWYLGEDDAADLRKVVLPD